MTAGRLALVSRRCWTATAFVVFASGSSVTAFAGDDAEVIYGDDNRHDLFDTANDPRMVAAASATAALVERGKLTTDTRSENMTKLADRTFAEAYSLCPTEPFRDQPNPAFCSGFLVGPNIFVTAGHCITDEATCADTALVFGFGYNAADQDPTLVPTSDIYYCRSIIARDQPPGLATDYAVIELDRAVTNRTPLQYRKEGMIAVGDDVTVIGHPSGLPTKISGGAQVRTSDASDAYFVANLDTYGGNSGSAVLNSVTGVVEGILVRGENDFVEEDGCTRSNICENDACRGEDVTRATEFAVHVPDPDAPVRQVRSVSFDAGTLNVAIPDADPDGVSTTFNVDATETVASVGVYVHLTHPYIGDLRIDIVHPDGTVAAAYNQTGGAQDNIDATFGLGGTRVGDLVRLRNKPANGVWKVVVKDLAGSDSGTLQALKLNLEVYID